MFCQSQQRAPSITRRRHTRNQAVFGQSRTDAARAGLSESARVLKFGETSDPLGLQSKVGEDKQRVRWQSFAFPQAVFAQRLKQRNQRLGVFLGTPTTHVPYNFIPDDPVSLHFNRSRRRQCIQITVLLYAAVCAGVLMGLPGCSTLTPPSPSPPRTDEEKATIRDAFVADPVLVGQVVDKVCTRPPGPERDRAKLTVLNTVYFRVTCPDVPREPIPPAHTSSDDGSPK